MEALTYTPEMWDGRFADRMNTMRKSAVRDLFEAAARSDIISLSGGMPEISSMPLDVVARVASDSVLEEGVAALQYGTTPGRIECRQVACDIMVGDGLVGIDPENVMLTSGAQQALDLLGRVFINPGDIIFCEGPTYLGALQAFSAYQPDFRCIEMDENGLRTDLLEEELKKLGRGKAKFVYCIPNFQNPTGVTLSDERRHHLVELSHEYDLPIIEDNPYGRLRYTGEPIAPMRSYDPNVIYLGTVSKIFAPGMRIGWILMPPEVFAKVNHAKQGGDLCGSTINQVMVEHYFHDTEWESVLATLIAKYAERRDAMLKALEDFFPKEATFTRPDGGFFIWATIPGVDTKKMLDAALKHGVTFVPGVGCYPDGRGGESIRIAFCYESPENLREAIRRLADVIEEQL